MEKGDASILFGVLIFIVICAMFIGSLMSGIHPDMSTAGAMSQPFGVDKQRENEEMIRENEKAIQEAKREKDRLNESLPPYDGIPQNKFKLTNYWSASPYCRVQEYTGLAGGKRYIAFILGKDGSVISLVKTKSGREYACLQGNSSELPLTLPYPATFYPDKEKEMLSLTRVYVIPNETDKTFHNFWGTKMFGYFDIVTRKWQSTDCRQEVCYF